MAGSSWGSVIGGHRDRERFELHELTPLDHLLTARWASYSVPRSGFHHASAFQEPWALHRARVRHLHDELVTAAGLPHTAR